MNYQFYHSVTYVSPAIQWNSITGLTGTRVIEGELFALKANVHQLDGNTHGDTDAVEEDHDN